MDWSDRSADDLLEGGIEPELFSVPRSMLMKFMSLAEERSEGGKWVSMHAIVLEALREYLNRRPYVLLDQCQCCPSQLRLPPPDPLGRQVCLACGAAWGRTGLLCSGYSGS